MTTNALANLITTERAIAQINTAMAALSIATDDLGELPEAKLDSEIPTAVQDSIDELNEMWVQLRTMKLWLSARRDGLRIATKSA